MFEPTSPREIILTMGPEAIAGLQASIEYMEKVNQHVEKHGIDATAIAAMEEFNLRRRRILDPKFEKLKHAGEKLCPGRFDFVPLHQFTQYPDLQNCALAGHLVEQLIQAAKASAPRNELTPAADSVSGKANKNLPDCITRAWGQYEEITRANPDLNKRDAYKLLQQQGEKLPKQFDTWERYIRKGEASRKRADRSG